MPSTFTVQNIENGGGKHDSLGFVVTVSRIRCLRNGNRLPLAVSSFLRLVEFLCHVK